MNKTQTALHGGLLRPDASNSAVGATAYGSPIYNGLIVVRSAYHNAGGSPLSVSIPDADGTGTINPANGLPLSDASNACLLDAMKVDGAYCVEGVSDHGKNCDPCNCDVVYYPCLGMDYKPWGAAGTNITVYKDGYVGVFLAADVKKGDALAFIDAPVLDADGNCLYPAGAVVPAGAGAQDLPAHWLAQESGVAGEFVEIKIS